MKYIFILLVFFLFHCKSPEIQNVCDPTTESFIVNEILLFAFGNNASPCLRPPARVQPSTPRKWVQEAYIKAPNAESGDQVGFSVAISGDTLVVGAPLEDSNQTTITNGASASVDNSISGSGAVYVFLRNVDSWTQQAYIKAPNVDAGDRFGNSVAISGDTIVVGANFEASNQTTIINGTTASADNSSAQAGAAYVFTRNGSTWSQQAYLKAPNVGTGDRFGESVAISGDTILVTAPFEDSNQTTIINGTGASIDNSASNAGSAYVFVRSGSTWSQQAYLKASNAGADDLFGRAVAISSDTVVVGARGEDSSQITITNGNSASSDNSAIDAGAAYVFVRNGSTWSQQAYLKAPNTAAISAFGTYVGIDRDTIVVGAPLEDSNQTTITNGSSASSDNLAIDAGAVYVFVRSGSTWSQQAYIKASNALAGARLGPVSIEGDTIVAAANFEASNQTTITNGNSASSDNSKPQAGSAYIFTRKGTMWTQEAYLKASSVDSFDEFGYSVSISADTVVAGVPFEDSNQTIISNETTTSSNNSAPEAGAVYVFVRK
ncbi:fibronectin type III domain protein [Leptospira ryugenii]|uniref:Fibronectin type III domain protein n=1 Tax=Leptospira ryugenii TaxID=1917863 RepID=A0A2P2E0K6_9LEPT|nr:hypothetical protein [Leptospira ryugenii]GBF50403.1 fibronectin type III domain protein [Leptospira ryugenii]